MMLREFKNKDRPNTQLGIQIISPCSHAVAGKVSSNKTAL